MSISAIMQPTYIPWIGYFDLIDKVDVFIFYDDVQLTKRSWQVRNKLRNLSGEFWLTVPISKTSSRDETRIMDAKINNAENWKTKHLNAIKHSYSKSLHFTEVYPVIESFYAPQWQNLSDFNIHIIENIASLIGIKTKRIKSSSLTGIDGQKDIRLVNIIKKLKIKDYLSPQGSANYINNQKLGGEFVNSRIDLFYHNYKHPLYNQINNKFIPYLGVYDLLFNAGFEGSLEIIQCGRKENIHYTKF